MKNIVLIGLMGAGKSSVGKKLAELLNYDFIDTDIMIENNEKMTIAEIFKQRGEKEFRKLENDLILRIYSTNDTIISTGGGCVQNTDNLNKLKENAITCYLKTTPEILYERVKAQGNRPLIETDNPLVVLENLLSAREGNYNKADFIIDTSFKAVGEIAKEIVKVYNANC